ncbi:MAG: noncanonical pyrimidine nucleotidase, YjjG family [Saprospiraceae bacterium]|nr:noncanonical pyrimidine nucleotidase, YjjG family [Saprospiraceae bacterium]
MRYHWLLFDADNTLFDFDRTMEVALETAMKNADLPFEHSFHEIYQKINLQCWRDFEEGKISKAALRTLRFELFFEAVEINYLPEAFEVNYLHHLSQGAFLIEDAQNLLQELHGTFRLGLVTNGLREVQRPRLAKSGLQHFFDVVVVSDEIGHAKPHAAFFDYAFQQMKHTRKHEVMMIGDSLNADIKGGADYGLDTCWYNPQELENDLNVQPTYQIKELMALKDVLDGNKIS